MRRVLWALAGLLCDASWVDPDTPKHADSVVSYDGLKHDLVFSDEFDVRPEAPFPARPWRAHL